MSPAEPPPRIAHACVPIMPYRLHFPCEAMWPDQPEMWCPCCLRRAGLDFPREATRDERWRAIREGIEHAEREQRCSASSASGY